MSIMKENDTMSKKTRKLFTTDDTQFGHAGNFYITRIKIALLFALNLEIENREKNITSPSVFHPLVQQAYVN